MKYKVVIWDWNGTLADDVQASLQATNRIFAGRNMPAISLEQYYACIDAPISKFYEHFFDLNVVPMSELGEEFYRYYPLYFEGLHDGVKELLQELQEQGVRQLILTSGNTNVVSCDLTRYGIRDYFEAVLGADDLLAAEKVERGLTWIRQQNIPPAEMVLLGDTLHDYDAARAMGVDCILGAIGHQSEKDLRTAGVPVVGSFVEFRQYLL